MLRSLFYVKEKAMDTDTCPYLHGYAAFCSDLPGKQLKTAYKTLFATGIAYYSARITQQFLLPAH